MEEKQLTTIYYMEVKVSSMEMKVKKIIMELNFTHGSKVWRSEFTFMGVKYLYGSTSTKGNNVVDSISLSAHYCLFVFYEHLS